MTEGGGHLVVVSGPSGVGKSTIAREVVRRSGAEFSVSATTRSPRPHERDGRDYHFVDRETFEKMIADGELLEWAEVFGELYGTPAEPVREALRQGRKILLDVDVQGGRQVHEPMPDATFVLILPPSDEELARRLRGRASESEQQIRRRLAKARDEIASAEAQGIYNHHVVNDRLEDAIETVLRIVNQPETPKQ
ncbi:MAG: guanylate kinase [Phycisphaerae bacterium]